MSVLGPELVTNGDFDDATGWTEEFDWAASGGIADGKAHYLRTNTIGDGVDCIYSSVSVVNGHTYQVSFDITAVSGASITPILAGVTGTMRSTVGTHTETIIAGSSERITLRGSGSYEDTASIDDVSVKEIGIPTEIEEAIFYILRWDPTVSGLISSRIYPEIIPQNTLLPAVYYTQIAGPRQHTLAATDDMVPSRWQLTVVADTYTELRGISDALRGVLDSYSGTVGTVVIQCSHMINENDLMDVQPGTDKLRRYIKAIDFHIWYND